VALTRQRIVARIDLGASVICPNGGRVKDKQKPNAEAAGWRRLQTDYPHQSRSFRLRRDRVRTAGEHEFDFTYVESQGAVWVVPVTPDNRVVLIRQYRYAVDEWVWEVPAGGMFDHVGDPESLARRELSEEIGAEAERMQYIGWFYGGVATTDTLCHVFIAHGTRLRGKPHPEPTEIIERHPVPLSEALRMARAGEIRDCRSALALLWSECYLCAPDPAVQHPEAGEEREAAQS
jgi:ADP-ribose pyrophosphatase